MVELGRCVVLVACLAACTSRNLQSSREVPTRLTSVAAVGDTPAARAGALALTATGEARDAIRAFGRLFVASSGGLLVYDRDGRYQRTLTWVDGLGSADATVLARFRSQVVVAGQGDTLSLVGESGLATLRLGDGATTSINDLAVVDDVLFVAARGLGLVAWDGQRAVARLPADGAEVTCLAAGPHRLALATASGGVYTLVDGTLRAVGQSLEERVTALAWDGDSLAVGHGHGVVLLGPGGERTPLRDGVDVTSIALDPETGRTFVGTSSSGVIVLGEEPGATERSVGGRARILRLRVLDGTLYALGPWTTARLGAALAPVVDRVPAPLTTGRVTAVAVTDGKVWVGTDVGVDVLTSDGVPISHLATSGARALIARPDRRDLLVATANGVTDVLADGSVRRIGTREGLFGEDVRGGAWLAGVAVFATERGLTVLGSDGGSRGLLDGVRARVVAFGPLGRIYVGTQAGLIVVDPDLGVERQLLPESAITALAVAARGVLVGTEAHGVFLVSPAGEVEPLALAPHTSVSPGALVTAGERAYVGTPAGLLVYSFETRRWHRVEALGSMAVNALAVDAGGSVVWVGTDRGLVRLPRTSVDTPGPSSRS